MPRIGSNFIFDSKSPNFDRDSYSTLYDMECVDDRYIDNGHISYCEETGRHYIYKNSIERWVELSDEMYVDSLDGFDIDYINDLLGVDGGGEEHDYGDYGIRSLDGDDIAVIDDMLSIV